jgi:transcriptional regulator with XRE-family HTH domain
MRCQRCEGSQFTKAGRDRAGRQIYQCATCARRHTDRSASAFRGYRFPDDLLARGLTTAQLAERLGMEHDRSTFYRMLNGATTEPRLDTLGQLCIALETSPSELLELAGVWSPETPGRISPDDLRLRGAFAQVRALPVATQQRVAPLVEVLGMAWTRVPDEPSADEDPRPRA